MSAVYTQAVQKQKDVTNGLSITNQGGEAYAINEMAQLQRFLILGSERPTYYASKEKLTVKNVESVQKALAKDGLAVINTIVRISKEGRAPSNEPAILALAMAAAYKDPLREQYSANVRKVALDHLSDVCRTGTHLFHFAEYVNTMRGWGSTLTKGVANWYLDKSAMALVNQITKYQQRDGWSHADLLRLSHPVANNGVQNAIFKYVVDGVLTEDAPDYLWALEDLKATPTAGRAIAKIVDHGFPRELIPTHLLNDKSVWEALLMANKGMPMNAMTRNLATMTRIGLLEQGSAAARFVIDRLHDEQAIHGSKLHPMELLKAKLTYEAGQSVRGSNTWTPVKSVVDALETGFYLAFGNVEPIGKSGLIAIDVSGSMTFGEMKGYGDLGRYYGNSYGVDTGIAGVPGLSPRIAATVIAMVTVRVERDCEIVGFSHGLVDLGISKHDSLSAAMQKTQMSDFGGTDCRLPFQYAIKNNRRVEWFAVYTDNETGYSNPAQTLRDYRKKTGIYDAKLIVNAMTSGEFSIADPSDRNMLDIVGFDTASPSLMSSFARGDI